MIPSQIYWKSMLSRLKFPHKFCLRWQLQTTNDSIKHVQASSPTTPLTYLQWQKKKMYQPTQLTSSTMRTAFIVPIVSTSGQSLNMLYTRYSLYTRVKFSQRCTRELMLIKRYSKYAKSQNRQRDDRHAMQLRWLNYIYMYIYILYVYSAGLHA